MNISIRVIPRASRVEVKAGNGTLKVYLTKPAVEGQANAQLISALADHFKVKKYQVTIKQGQNSRNKVIAIEDVPNPRGKQK